MNIKKQLKKIANYIEQIEHDNNIMEVELQKYEAQHAYQSYVKLFTENKRLSDKLAKYKSIARDFVEFNQPDHICRMRFKAMMKEGTDRTPEQQDEDGEE